MPHPRKHLVEPTAVAEGYTMTEGDQERMGGQESENAPDSKGLLQDCLKPSMIKASTISQPPSVTNSETD